MVGLIMGALATYPRFGLLLSFLLSAGILKDTLGELEALDSSGILLPFMTILLNI